MHSRRNPNRALMSAAWEVVEEGFVGGKGCATKVGGGRARAGRRPARQKNPGQTPHLVVAADQVHCVRVLDLEREQQADGFQRVRAAVDIVAQEDVVDVSDVPRRARRAVLFKKAHEVPKLAVQVAKDLGGG